MSRYRCTITPLFLRFYRYAIDIDNGCRFVDHFVQPIKTQRGYFLDLGFAPGGMSKLLLDGTCQSYGLGLTLPVSDGGNAFIAELDRDRHPRFLCRYLDIVHVAHKAKRRRDVLEVGPH